MKIYMSGAIYGGLDKIEIYKVLLKELSKYGEVLNPQVADPNTINNEKGRDDEEIYTDLEEKLKIADIIFAEVSVKSLGVGYELGFADKLGKKIIAIYDQNYCPKVTTMIRGNKRIQLIPYEKIEEITSRLEELLKR